MYLVDEYGVIGSGSNTAFDFLEQIDNILKSKDTRISKLSIEINVGISMYIICRAKNRDPYSGGDTQIGIIDNKGFRKIPIDDQTPYYYKMIKHLSELLNEEEDKIREQLPVSRTMLL
jgi:20S proteasome alpha/beta subunit